MALLPEFGAFFRETKAFLQAIRVWSMTWVSGFRNRYEWYYAHDMHKYLDIDKRSLVSSLELVSSIIIYAQVSHSTTKWAEVVKTSGVVD